MISRFICCSFMCVMPTLALAETAPKIINIHHADAITSKQGLSQFVGISGKNSGAIGISMNKVVVPPGGQAKPHTHSDFESVIYVLKGHVRTYFGADLKEFVDSEVGDFMYIPPGVAHYPVNLSQTEEAIGIVARTDPDEQEHVIMYPAPAAK